MASAELDPSSGVPLYRQIKEILRAEIVGGASVDTGMTEAQLLDRFNVSRAPIRQALMELASEGYVYRRQGKGTFPVRGTRVERPANVRPGDLYRYLSEQGLKPSSTVTGIERLGAPAQLHEVLHLERAEELLHFTRLISVEGRPLAEAEVFIRAPRDFSPTAAQLEQTGSAFQLLERGFGIALDGAEHVTWATAATGEHATALGVSVGDPLLVIETTFFAVGRLPVGWRSAVHRADDFKFRFLA
jgi:GntR family transcriptional regulator